MRSFYTYIRFFYDFVSIVSLSECFKVNAVKGVHLFYMMESDKIFSAVKVLQKIYAKI